MSSSLDRNFDPISEHFVKKVYGGLKGDIRLAVLQRDISQVVSELSLELNRPLRVLDIGAGLAQLSLQLAAQGHDVTINDISENMLEHAKSKAVEQGVLDKVHWVTDAYQGLADQLTHTSYDLILCHAVLEWLEHPADIIPFFKQWLSKTGYVSLCFYNPVSFVYRNLIMGNFNLLNNPNFKSDNKKSLTPNNPVSFEEVEDWLQQTDFEIKSVTGLRVFHDYSPLKRGGHTNPQAVIDMELRYSTQIPYKWLGRYLHILTHRA